MKRELGEQASESEIERLFELTEGLPLALRMIVAHVKHTGSTPEVSSNPQLRVRDALNQVLAKARQQNPFLDLILRPLVADLSVSRAVVWEEFSSRHNPHAFTLVALDGSCLFTVERKAGKTTVKPCHKIVLEFLKEVFETKSNPLCHRCSRPARFGQKRGRNSHYNELCERPLSPRLGCPSPT